ncbi:hypothetical protein D3C72_2330190 [compost metagenome]
MLGENGLNDGQAKTGSLFGALDRDRALTEGRQHHGNFIFGYAGAIIPDRHILAAARRPAGFHKDFTALRREFHGI